jgi:MATE family multidrug resistance protein
MTRGLLLTMFGAMLTFFITYFALKPWLGNHALWLAFNLYLIMRGALQLLYYRKKADR